MITKLNGKYVLFVISSLNAEIEEFVETAIEANANLTLLCAVDMLTTKLTGAIIQGSIGHLTQGISTIDLSHYHLVVIQNGHGQLESIREKCVYFRTWFSVLNAPEISDFEITTIAQSETIKESNALPVILQPVNTPSRLKPKLYLVGAGLGSAQFLTVRAKYLLETCPVIISDRLVSQEILSIIPSTTRIIFSRKVCGKAELAQKEINAWILDHLKQGTDVLRLKGGDPFVFGRGGEEWNLVAGIYEIEWVPGISSCIAAAGAAGIPVTHRGVADGFLVSTGMKKDGSWANIPLYESKTTLVLLMATGSFGKLSKHLIQERGYPVNIPVAIVHRATLKNQQVLRGNLSDAATLLDIHQISNHSTIIVGNVVQVLLQNSFLF